MRDNALRSEIWDKVVAEARHDLQLKAAVQHMNPFVLLKIIDCAVDAVEDRFVRQQQMMDELAERHLDRR